jgi:hypothetical protein
MNKYKMIVESRAPKNTVSSYPQVKTVGEKESQLAAQEAILAFHTAVYRCSFKSMDSTTAIIKTLFNQKMACCQTKPRRLSPNLWYHLL